MIVLGIDFGGSGIKGAPVNTITGELIKERHRISTPLPSTPEAVSEVIKQITEHFDWNGPIGIGIPGVVQHGVVKTAANIDSSWINFSADNCLSKACNNEVFAVNDADAAGLAEVTFGSGKNKGGVILLLTIGTGIGSVIFTEGKLLPNTELGHLQFKDKTIETYASDAVRKKEDLSWDKWAKRFSKILKYYEQLLYPDLIIVGGGCSKKWDKYQKDLKNSTPTAPAQLLNNAGIIGAALYAAQQSKTNQTH